jgi:hypothetical protein
MCGHPRPEHADIPGTDKHPFGAWGLENVTSAVAHPSGVQNAIVLTNQQPAIRKNNK